MTSKPPVLKIKVQVYCGDEIAMGPGKADLLDAIDGEGSISAAARVLGMSYRRAWLLVDAMNRCWQGRLVETSSSAAVKSGARLTPFGRGILQLYRALQQRAGLAADGRAWDELNAALLCEPKPQQRD